MNRHSEVDYIIVGLGLAGACMALQLIRRNRTVRVFDQPSENRSTSVAAGLINPITGKVLSKTYMADALFPYCFTFYTENGQKLHSDFVHTMPIYRPFLSIEEQNEWMGRSAEKAMKEYIAEILLTSTYGDEVNDPFGGVLLRRSGYVDTNRFVESVRDLLRESGSYRNEMFVDDNLLIEESQVTYNGLSAGKLIFCRGVEDLKSGYFGWLPIRPLKGEILQIKMAPVDRIYNRGVYVAPAGQAGLYNVGSTYDSDLTSGTTEKGRIELQTKLSDLLRRPYEITSQKWGIRPTTPDRRPLLGIHPKHRNLAVFNGLGTKGVSLAPYFSDQLAGRLEGESEIILEVNIGRFKSLYSKFD